MNQMLYIVAMAVMLIGAATAVGASGGGESAEQVTKITLLTDRGTISPGGSMRVGLMFEMKEHWHIYWRNPGEAGLPPRVRWKLPEGFVMSDLRWPTPVQFDQGGGIVGYGYMGKVMLLATLTAPSAEKLETNKSIYIAADVDWLVCNNVCLPGKTAVSVEAAVGEGAIPGAKNEALFAYWDKRLPERDAVKVTQVTGEVGRRVTATMAWGKPVTDATFFPLPDTEVMVTVVKVTNRGEQADVALSVRPIGKLKADAIRVRGLVVWMEDGRRRSSEVDLPLRSAHQEARRK
ncbi:MAG: protein-disulfide reductase DsbD domain-containing protein [Phycisphaeraceae bacterium]